MSDVMHEPLVFFKVNVQSGCWVLLTESFSKVVSSIKSLQEEHPDGNQVVIDPGRLVPTND